MDEFTKVFQEASAGVEPGYFHLNIHGGDPVYRERVYCYELYHQMRLRWPTNCRFWLNGEIDKAAHPILAGMGVGRAKPDFLVHFPGDMAGNYAIIEVKPEGAGNGDIRTDLDKLSLFTAAVGYRRAIYLVYGHHPDATMERIHAARAADAERLGPIELWAHTAPGAQAFRYG